MDLVLFIGFLFFYVDYIIENEREERRKRHERLPINKRKVLKNR